MTPEDPARERMPDDPPPFLGTWRRVYLAVLMYLASLVVTFWVFTKVFS